MVVLHKIDFKIKVTINVLKDMQLIPMNCITLQQNYFAFAFKLSLSPIRITFNFTAKVLVRLGFTIIRRVKFRVIYALLSLLHRFPIFFHFIFCCFCCHKILKKRKLARDVFCCSKLSGFWKKKKFLVFNSFLPRKWKKNLIKPLLKSKNPLTFNKKIFN